MIAHLNTARFGNRRRWLLRRRFQEESTEAFGILDEMRQVEALHTAARRYCRARHDECWEAYRELILRLAREGKGYWKTNEFTQEEIDLYPRYLVLWPILRDIERLQPNASANVDGLREMLSQIGREAADQLTSNLSNEAGMAVMDDERQRFIEHISSLSQRNLAAIKPLPFRRVLAPDEEIVLWGELKKQWHIEGPWYPLVSGDPPANTVAFHTHYFDTKKVEALRRILFERGIDHLWEVRWSVACEIDLSSFCPSFEVSAGSNRLYGAGEEGYWTSAGIDWLVYASHENSITLTGEWLVSAFQSAMPGCSESTFTW
jgi:hypothetical protein